jgi:hypothetical protein
MAEYIDKVAATTIPTPPKENRVYQTYNLDDVFDAGWHEAQRCISNLPAADVRENVKGEWLRTPTSWVYCSVCGEEPPQETNVTSDFCPNCGAKMDDVYQPPICGPGEEDGDG